MVRAMTSTSVTVHTFLKVVWVWNAMLCSVFLPDYISCCCKRSLLCQFQVTKVASTHGEWWSILFAEIQVLTLSGQKMTDEFSMSVRYWWLKGSHTEQWSSSRLPRSPWWLLSSGLWGAAPALVLQHWVKSWKCGRGHKFAASFLQAYVF